MSFTSDSVVKNLPANAGDMGSILGLVRSTGGGNGKPFQYSSLGSPWTEEPGGLQSMGSQRVSQKILSNYITITTAATFYNWFCGQIVLHLKLETSLGEGGEDFLTALFFSPAAAGRVLLKHQSSHITPLSTTWINL